MTQINTIFSARDEKTDSNLETATERETNQRAEISEIVATLAAQKSAWLVDHTRDEILRGWAGLR
ncbi:MAG: hypothetical protein EBR79_04120 [Proteobacteria bacterium]|nr:hypothetical protein [Pseudomonadota bacterium]NDD53708.1 hypothetical protein [bacterium]